MPDLRKARGAETRGRLVRGAREVIYHRGVERTSLADVAEQAGIPVGNIYYYFKTKDDLVEAAVRSYAEDREEMFARLERRRTPRARLKALIDELDAGRQSVAQFGCPVGTLSAELDKRCGTDASPESQDLLGSMVNWTERQFREAGRPDARDLAISLIAEYEGTTILAHSLRDPQLMHRQSERLQRWVDDVCNQPD